MASINGLQNNALIVNTIDGLTTLYATSIYDNGQSVNPALYVPYSGATGAVDLNAQNLIDINTVAAVSGTLGSLGVSGTSNLTTLNVSGTTTLTGVSSGTASTYLALNASNQIISSSGGSGGSTVTTTASTSAGPWYPTFVAYDTGGSGQSLYVDGNGYLNYNALTGNLSCQNLNAPTVETSTTALTLGVSGQSTSLLTLQSNGNGGAVFAGNVNVGGSLGVSGTATITGTTTTPTVNSTGTLNLQSGGTTYAQVSSSSGGVLTNTLGTISTADLTASVLHWHNFQSTSLTSASYPTGVYGTGVGSIGFNFDGQSSVDFMNNAVVVNALTGFNFYQRTGTSTNNALGALNQQGFSVNTSNAFVTITSIGISLWATNNCYVTVYFSTQPASFNMGQWVAISGFSGTLSSMNGTFMVYAGTSGSVTFQTYTQPTGTYTSGAVLVPLSTTTAGITFGDQTSINTHQTPITTLITSSAAIPGTPLAIANQYTTPVGAKYLKVRIIGAGGGGQNYLAGNANYGGYTTFGSFLAMGGSISPYSGLTIYANSSFPFLDYTGGMGGGYYPVTGLGTTTTTMTLTFPTMLTISPIMIYWPPGYTPVAGQTVYTTGFIPTSLNGSWTVTTSGNTQVTVSTTAFPSGVSVSVWGYFTVSPPPGVQVQVCGGCGQSGYVNSNVSATTVGGTAMFGTCTPPFNNNNAGGGGGSNTYPSIPLGMASYGGGGCGGTGVSGNIAGAAGGGGQYTEVVISNPISSYAYVIGAGGKGASTDGGARYQCGPGNNGCVIVEAYF
jgi:collagen type VII alpha